MAVEVLNRQRKIELKTSFYLQFAERAVRAVQGEDAQSGATIIFVSDRAMRNLNYRFRGRPSTTDVLSFPSSYDSFEEGAGDSLGDVVISVERAREQASDHNLEFDDEIKQLILHGLLHLSGYDHETDNGEMNRLELKLRRQLGI